MLRQRSVLTLGGEILIPEIYVLHFFHFNIWVSKVARFRGKVGQSVRLTRERSPVRIWPKAFWHFFSVFTIQFQSMLPHATPRPIVFCDRRHCQPALPQSQVLQSRQLTALTRRSRPAGMPWHRPWSMTFQVILLDTPSIRQGSHWQNYISLSRAVTSLTYDSNLRDALFVLSSGRRAWVWGGVW